MLSSHLCIGLPSGNLPFKFPNKNVVYISHLPMRATCPVNLTLLDLVTRIIQRCPLYLTIQRTKLRNSKVHPCLNTMQ